MEFVRTTTCIGRIDFEVSIVSDIEKYFSYRKKKIFFISSGDLCLLFTMNCHVFLRTSKAARFQFKDSKINWNILSLSNVVYVDKKKKKETNTIEIVETIFYSSLLILESIFSHI